MTLLDERLEEVGLLAGRATAPPDRRLDRSGARMLPGHAARAGNWYGDYAVTDLAFSVKQVGPIHTVKEPGDFGIAQRPAWPAR